VWCVCGVIGTGAGRGPRRSRREGEEGARAHGWRRARARPAPQGVAGRRYPVPAALGGPLCSPANPPLPPPPPPLRGGWWREEKRLWRVPGVKFLNVYQELVPLFSGTEFVPGISTTI
jgi:hypothetical protein